MLSERFEFREAVDLVANIEPERMDAGLSSNVATAYFYVEDYDNAESFYRRSIALEPNRPIYHRNLGDLFLLHRAVTLCIAPDVVAVEDAFGSLRDHPDFAALTQPPASLR